jgi:hypothetical protein
VTGIVTPGGERSPLAEDTTSGAGAASSDVSGQAPTQSASGRSRGHRDLRAGASGGRGGHWHASSGACLLLYEDYVWVSLGNAMKAKQSKVKQSGAAASVSVAASA